MKKRVRKATVWRVCATALLLAVSVLLTGCGGPISIMGDGPVDVGADPDGQGAGHKDLSTPDERDTATAQGTDQEDSSASAAGDAVVAKAMALAEAVYPEAAPYPDEEGLMQKRISAEEWDAQYDAWSAERKARRERQSTVAPDAMDFFRRTAPTILKSENGENAAYAPLNVYLALSLLASVSAGDTGAQVLALLGADSVEALQKTAEDLWLGCYRDDGAATCTLANSIWLSRGEEYNEDLLKALSERMYLSAYQGVMGDEAYDNALRQWINDNTGNLLKEQAGELSFSAETVFALASTIYFRGKWDAEFRQENNEVAPFHGPSGDEDVTYMCQRTLETYYWADQFAAIGKPFATGETMYLILPDEGVSPDALYEDPALYGLLDGTGAGVDSTYINVNLRMPKFDIAASRDLCASLMALGVTDAFQMGADFSPLSDREDLYVSEVKHAVRVTVDEEGCTAAAFTEMQMCGSAMPPEDEVDLTLDRPFLFVIVGETGVPLFAGTVNRP